MNNIGTIICYFGKWPDFFPLFLSSIIWNKDIHWLIFSDNDDVFPKYPNISFYRIDKTEFNRLVSKKTNLNIKIKDPYKLCDFKPLYGKIFEDYLSNYKFWGYSDIDVIYGQISNFITDETLRNYDIISTYKGFLSGPFCLYKNQEPIISLFTEINNYKKICQDLPHYGIDENIQRAEIKSISFRKLVFGILYLFNSFLTKMSELSNNSWKEFRYQFQWYYKRKTIRKKELVDMTEVIWHNHRKEKLNVFFKELLASDSYYKRINKKHWKLVWKNGKLIDQLTGKQLFGFHFIQGKYKSDFTLIDYSIQNNKFTITEQGIY